MAESEKAKLSAKTKIVIAVVGVSLAGVTVYGLLQVVSGSLLGRPIKQPIAFSHKLHAGEKTVDCQYCHTAARRSTSAGLPSVERCMGCHKYIAVKKQEIRKLADYWEKKQPIPWVRVYRYRILFISRTSGTSSRAWSARRAMDRCSRWRSSTSIRRWRWAGA